MVTSSAPRPGRVTAGAVIAVLVGIASAGLVLLILSQFLFQVFHSQRTSPFIFVKDVPLPSALPTKFIANARDLPKQETPLTPGVSIPFDGFDFQALDPVTKLLFFAHGGPGTDVYAQFNPAFDPDKDSQLDGYVGVIDTRRKLLVVLVIDVLHNNTVSRINLGHMPKLPAEDTALLKFGYDVGHNHYDPQLRRVFVTSQQLTDQSVLNPITPPGGTGELISIDPVTQRI